MQRPSFWRIGQTVLLIAALTLGLANQTGAFSGAPGSVALASVAGAPGRVALASVAQQDNDNDDDEDNDNDDEDEQRVQRGQVLEIFTNPYRTYPQHSLIVAQVGPTLLEVVLLDSERQILQSGVEPGDHVRLEGSFETVTEGTTTTVRFLASELEVTEECCPQPEGDGDDGDDNGDDGDDDNDNGDDGDDDNDNDDNGDDGDDDNDNDDNDDDDDDDGDDDDDNDNDDDDDDDDNDND